GSKVLIGRYDPRDQQVACINVGKGNEGVAQSGTRHVRVDERGWLWLTHCGVMVYDGQAWHPFSASLLDIDFSATRLTYEDREGNIWIGLWGGGLIFCDPTSIHRYTAADGLPDREVRHLGEDHEGRMWIGTMGGMAYMEEGQVRPERRGKPSGRWWWMARDISGVAGIRARCTSGRAKRHKRSRWPKRPIQKQSLGYAEMDKGVSGSVRPPAASAG
ncbi:MAG: hypothetical protein OXH63_25600, partial [Gemmatimonadetes bacterium]|nr:hypothetical protein [Gemmatimonadota bacterium]